MARQLWLCAVLAVIFLAVVIGTSLWESPVVDVSLADSTDAALVSRGAAVYRQHCAGCHGADLEGEPNWRERKPDGRLPAPPHDATGHTWHHPDQDLFRITKHGLRPPLAPAGYQSDMPAFDDILDDDEIWAVLAFIKSTWPEAIRARQARSTQLARP